MSPTLNDYFSVLCKDESRYVASWIVGKAGIGLKLLVGGAAEVFGLLLLDIVYGFLGDARQVISARSSMDFKAVKSHTAAVILLGQELWAARRSF